MDFTVDFRQQLSRQLGFLERSCASYDAGHQDESIRIATTIRILMHQTERSTSLLGHLKAFGINLVSTSGGASMNAVMYTGIGRFRHTSEAVTYTPKLDLDALTLIMPVKRWWNQVVYVSGSIRLSRKDLVLSAADKDGGAHVDKKLTIAYQSLMNVGGVGFFSKAVPDQPGKFIPIMDAHLVYLRQMGFELLSSPELTALRAPARY